MDNPRYFLVFFAAALSSGLPGAAHKIFSAIVVFFWRKPFCFLFAHFSAFFFSQWPSEILFGGGEWCFYLLRWPDYFFSFSAPAAACVFLAKEKKKKQGVG